MEGAMEIRRGFMCSICNGFLRDSYNLPCGHTFCLGCVNNALADSNSCPTCMNPAWQKDILKTALTDSAVQEWVTHCEAKFLALVARQEEQGDDDDDEDTETDSALEASSGNDEPEDTDTDTEVEREEEERQEEEREKHQPASAPISAAETRQQQEAPQAPKDQEMASAARAGVAVGAGASGHSADQGPKGGIRLHGDQSNGAATEEGGGAPASLSDAKPAAADHRRSAVGGQEKENFAAAPSARPPSAAGAGAGAADGGSAAAAPSPRVVGIRRAAAWGSFSSDRSKAPRVRFQPSPLRAGGPEADPHGEGAFGEGPTSCSQRNHLSPTVAAVKAGGASSSLAVADTTSVREAATKDAEKLTRDRGTPEAPRIERSVGNSSAASSSGTPAAVGLERRGSTPPRRVLEKACEDAASTPRPSPPQAGGEAAPGVRDQEEASGFALALPDTCDIVDADPLPLHPPTVTTSTMLLSPPAFQVDHASSAAAAAVEAGCDIDAAGAPSCPVGRVGPGSGRGEGNRKLAGVDGGPSPEEGVGEVSGRDVWRPLSPQSQVGAPPNPASKEDANSSSPAAKGEDLPTEERTRVGGDPVVGESQDTDVEAGLADSEVRDDSSRDPPARRAAGDAGHGSTMHPAEGAGGSRGEDEVSDAESVALLGDDELQRGENGQQHQQQRSTTSVTPSRVMPSSRSVSTPGGASGPGDGPIETAKPSFGGGGGEGSEDEGEETCDEDCGETGAAGNSPGGGEQSAPGSDIPVEERKDRATGVEATGPSTGDKLERLGPAECLGSPSSSSLFHPGFSTGVDVAEREAIHSTAAGNAANKPCAEERPAVNLARQPSPTLAASPATGLQREGRDTPAAHTGGTEPAVAVAVAISAGSSSPRSRSLRRQSQASTSPAQSFGLQDGRQTDKDVACLEGDEGGDGGRGGTRVAETLPQSLGLGGGGDVRGEGAVAEQNGVDGDVAVPETSAERVLFAETRTRKAAESSAGGVGADDRDPVIPETSVQNVPVAAEVPRGRGGKSLVEGVEDLGACGVQVADIGVARAESQEQGGGGNGGAAALGEEKTGMQEVTCSHDVRGASGGPAQPADGSQKVTLSQAAPREQGPAYNPGAPHHQLPKDNGSGEKELSRLEARDPSERRLESDGDKVRETPQPRGTSGHGEASSERTTSPAVQGLPEQDGSGAREDSHEEKAERRVPETAAQNVTSQDLQTLSTQEVPETAAQSITTQQIQTLSTQEVPETARAWGSTADSSAQLKRAASGLLMASSSCPQSEELEAQPLRDVVTTGSSAGCAGAGEGDEATGKGKQEQSATSARGSPSLSPPALPAETVVQDAAEGDPGAAGQEQAGAICPETPGGALVLHGCLVAGAAVLHGAADSGEDLESATSPSSGSHRKRSADSATLSPSRTSSATGSAGKRLRMTPPSVDGESRPVRPGAATDDEDVSPNGLPDRGSSSGVSRQEAGGGEQGPPMALRGGSGSGESGNESELPETDHDLAAVQDAWHAEGGYEFGDDGGGYPDEDDDADDEPEESRPPSLPPPSPPKGKAAGAAAAVFNPYATQAHLDLHADVVEDSCPADDAAGSAKPSPPGRGASKGHGGPGGTAGATAAVQGRTSRAALPRPSRSTMGFGTSSVGAAARPASATGLGGSALAARLKEKHHRESSNAILGAGRAGHATAGGATVATASAGKTGSWSTYDMGPDTQDLAEVEARLARKWAGKNPCGGAAMESSPCDPINLDGDEDDDNNPAKQGETSAEKKRKRSSSSAAAAAAAAAAATAATSKGKEKGRSTHPRRTVQSNGDERRRRRRRDLPVVVLLGCSVRELNRTQQLCKRLRLRQPETELVSGATHVVVGSRHTRAPSSNRSSSGGGGSGGGECAGGGSLLDKRKERSTGRRELAKHGLKGFREAVMLGLWVLDFSWVEACCAAEEADAGADAEAETGGKGGRDDDGALPLAAPPRAFELLGCSDGHEGCEPRRGRYKKGSGVPGVFDGIDFVPVVAVAAAPGGGRSSPPSSPSRLELEMLRSETERLVKLGGGVLVSEPRNKHPSRADETAGYLDNPFDFDEVVDVDAGGGSAHGRGGGGGGEGAAAKGKKVVVLALPDCLDGHGVSQSLAKAAARRRQELGANAAVDRAWVLRSADKGSPISFGGYDLGRSIALPEGAVGGGSGVGGSGGGGSGGGGGGNSKRPAGAAKSRLSIPKGASTRCEVYLDMEHDGSGRRMVSPAAARAQRELTAEILRKADEVVEAPVRQKLPPLDPTGLGEDGFDFTRRGSKKAPVKANVVTYTAENKAQRDLIDALHKGGYLDLDCSEDEDEVDLNKIDKEKRLGEYWYDYVYDGFFMKRSENAIPEAKRRGCPVDILRAEHESHASIQTERSRNCVKELPGEFSVWKAGRDADDAVELL